MFFISFLFQNGAPIHHQEGLLDEKVIFFKLYIFFIIFLTKMSPAILNIDVEDQNTLTAPTWVNLKQTSPTSKLKKLRLKGKDYKKGGDGLRGKNVTEAYRVKEKDLKRTMK